MDKVKVVFRKVKNGDIIAFMPEIKANYGNIKTRPQNSL